MIGLDLDRARRRRGARHARSPRAPSPSTARRSSCWGLILVLALVGVLLFAERRLEGGVSAFAGQAAALPGTEAEREASTRGLEQTEVFPLMLFAVGGMMLFPAANDLLTMFVALEVLSLPLYLLCGLARRRRLLEPGGGAEVLPARCVLLGLLPLRHRAGLRVRRVDGASPSIAEAVASDDRQPTRCCWSASGCSRSACCSRSAPCRSTRGRRTSTRAPRPRSPAFMAAVHQGGGVRRAAAGLLRRLRRRRAGPGSR